MKPLERTYKYESKRIEQTNERKNIKVKSVWGLSPRKIVRALNISKNTAKKYVLEPQKIDDVKAQQAITEPWVSILKELQRGQGYSETALD